jgi:hypothetical protein
MRKSKLPLKKLYAFVSHFLKRVGPNKQAKKKGRPQKYEDALIITLWLFQMLNNYSYRETLEKAKDEGLNVPSLCDYHYRVKQLDDELLKSILEERAKLLLGDKQTLCYIADATGFGFGDKYNLNWKRGTQIRTVQSHVRLEVIMAVDENKRKIITAVETGGPYESEIEMLRKALKKLQPQKGLPFVADKGYDAVDIIESLLDRGFEPAIRIKETMRMSIKHPLRKLSNENWKRYGKIRYRVEQLFGSIKQKIGSSFKLLREDLARKASIACAILWNFWLLATYLFLLFLSGILHYGYAKDCGRFLEQPQHTRGCSKNPLSGPSPQRIRELTLSSPCPTLPCGREGVFFVPRTGKRRATFRTCWTMARILKSFPSSGFLPLVPRRVSSKL